MRRWLPDAPAWSLALGWCFGVPVAMIVAIAIVSTVRWHLVGRKQWWAKLQALKNNADLQALEDAALREK
jgi:hypothetical protein